MNDTPILSGVHGYDPHWLDLFEQYYGAINPWSESFVLESRGAVMSARRMFPDEDLKRTEFYSDWVLPQDNIILGGGGFIGHSDRTIALLGANMPLSCGMDAERKWLGMVEKLMPALQQSWSIGQTFAKGLVERLLLERSSATDPVLFLLSESGQISFWNGRGEVALASQDVIFTDKNGRLRFKDDHAQQVMAHMLRDMRRGPVHAYLDLACAPSTVRVEMTAFDPDQVPDWDLGLFLGIERPSLMVCISTHTSADDRGDLVMKSYGLSAAEAEVATLVADGLSLREITEARLTSINTVRKQVRAIAEKMDVSRQTEIALTVNRNRKTH